MNTKLKIGSPNCKRKMWFTESNTLPPEHGHRHADRPASHDSRPTRCRPAPRTPTQRASASAPATSDALAACARTGAPQRAGQAHNRPRPRTILARHELLLPRPPGPAACLLTLRPSARRPALRPVEAAGPGGAAGDAPAAVCACFDHQSRPSLGWPSEGRGIRVVVDH